MYVKGDMGAKSTGVRRWKAFCASEGIAFARALEAYAPLRLKLQEEWLCMRFIASLVGVQLVMGIKKRSH